MQLFCAGADSASQKWVLLRRQASNPEQVLTACHVDGVPLRRPAVSQLRGCMQASLGCRGAAAC